MDERYLRRENEDNTAYLVRLSEIKVRENPDDLEIGDIHFYTNFQCHYDSIRKALQPKEYGGLAIVSHYMKEIEKYKEELDGYKNNLVSDSDVLKQYDIKRIELEKEKQRFYDQRTAYNKVIRDEARKDELRDIIEKVISSGNLPKLEYKPKDIIHKNNDLYVSLNDLHYGIVINNAWNSYDSRICAERLSHYIDEILKAKELYGAENVFVCANGDLVSGNIHPTIQIANKEDLIQQVMGVSELISDFLSVLANEFKSVNFTVVAGNHSRLSTKENSPKDERMDILIPWYTKARLQNFKNITYTENIDSTMAVINIRGKKYLQVHGDYENGKQAKQSVALMSGEDIYAICCGHLHHCSTDYVDKIKIIMAGSLMGMDDYCIQKRIIGIPQQLICVCNENGVLATLDVNFN